MTTVSEDLLARARKLWLSSHADMEEVERLYRAVHAQEKKGDNSSNNKKQKMLGDESDGAAAREKLALLLCQSGRSQEASTILSSLGYMCRLSSVVLDYPTTHSHSTSITTEQQQQQSSSKTKQPPLAILDNFLTNDELQVLTNVFGNPESSYWIDHNYQVEPPSPYFSYLIPLDKSDEFGFIGHLVQKCFHSLKKEFPLLSKNASVVEMWAHNRPHASGHQMHFDSDNEGMGGVRNPIISTILYITDGTGGPSLVTNQKLVHGQLATKGWVSHAKEKRLVAFDGKVLHGVVPGKGSSDGDGRRVTLMFAFWKKIKVREDGGAAQVFSSAGDWAKSLRRDFVGESETTSECSSTIVSTPPTEIKPIYETLQGEAWTRDMGFPEYDKVFQGF